MSYAPDFEGSNSLRDPVVLEYNPELVGEDGFCHMVKCPEPRQRNISVETILILLIIIIIFIKH